MDDNLSEFTESIITSMTQKKDSSFFVIIIITTYESPNNKDSRFLLNTTLPI